MLTPTNIIIGLFILAEVMGLVVFIGVIILQKMGAEARMRRGDESDADRQWKRTVSEKTFGGGWY